MDKKEIQAYFDKLAPKWDETLVHNDAVIADILAGAEIGPGQSVLDVACGTGVLVPDYLSRGAASVTGVDLSPAMIAEAEGKFHDPRVRFVCADAETAAFGERFDRIVVYNALPHFPEPGRLIARLAELLQPGGILSIAHGMSRAQIDRRHEGGASAVSRGLMDEHALAALFAPHLTVTVCRSTDRLYQVSGRRDA
jgi:ubiquinone/menaquinone biosynthesis C-methylase UbiE